MNLDPRSEFLNSEMGVVIDRLDPAPALKQRMLADMDHGNGWQVELDADGRLLWTSALGQRNTEPAPDGW